jgi:hypothetical protein
MKIWHGTWAWLMLDEDAHFAPNMHSGRGVTPFVEKSLEGGVRED